MTCTSTRCSLCSMTKPVLWVKCIPKIQFPVLCRIPRFKSVLHVCLTRSFCSLHDSLYPMPEGQQISSSLCFLCISVLGLYPMSIPKTKDVYHVPPGHTLSPRLDKISPCMMPLPPFDTSPLPTLYSPQLVCPVFVIFVVCHDSVKCCSRMDPAAFM
jgi:hypothetical protein